MAVLRPDEFRRRWRRGGVGREREEGEEEEGDGGVACLRY